MNEILANINNLDRNSKILLGLIILIGLLIILIFLFNFFSGRKEKKLYRKINKNKRKLKKEIEEESKDVLVTPKVNKVIEEISVKPEIKEEMIIEDPIEVLNEDNEIEKLINDIKSINSSEELFDLTEFEKEQEESAIISYDELCKRAGVQKKEYGKKEEVVKKETYEGKYKPSKVISPIYGIQK